MTGDLNIPDGWQTIEIGSTTLYAEPVDGTFVVRFAHIADYYGGQDMVGVYRVDGGEAHEVFRSLGEYQKSKRVLQACLNDARNR